MRILQTPFVQNAPITGPRDLVTREWVEAWVDDALSGKIKAPVRVVSSSNIAGTYAPGTSPAPVTRGTFTLTATGALEIDGIGLSANDRVLLAGQATAQHNGIYIVTNAGGVGTSAVLTRATDFDRSELVLPGVTINVVEGTSYAGTTWKLATQGVITLDVTALDFIMISRVAGAMKVATTITGNNVTTLFNVVHDLGTTDVVISVYNNNSIIMTGLNIVDANTISVGFAMAPTPAMTFRVVVIG